MELQKLSDKELEVLAKNIQDEITRRKTLATVTIWSKELSKKKTKKEEPTENQRAEYFIGQKDWIKERRKETTNLDPSLFFLFP